MKVLFITTTYPTPRRPRQGAFNQVLVQALRARHEVFVIAPIPWVQCLGAQCHAAQCHGAQCHAAQCLGVTDHDCDGARVLHPTYYYPPKLLRKHYHQFFWHSIHASIRQLEQEFVPDVVMGYWLHPDGAAAVRAAQRYHVPAIVMSGGTDLRLLTRNKHRHAAIMRVLEKADRLIVFSQELARQAHRLSVSLDDVDVVYRGVDRRCFHPSDQTEARLACGLPQDGVVIFWAGRLSSVKNPDMLLEAATRWKRLWGRRLRLIVAGDGPLRNQLHRRRRRLDLEDVLFFSGDLTHKELALHYNAADVTVLTSLSEGVPNVLLESIACETPFVATDVGGVAEIATPGIDRLVPAGNTDALADAVIQQIRTAPRGCRIFVPTDLAGMADQIDATIARAASSRDPRASTPNGLLLSPLSLTCQQIGEEVTR